MYATIVFACCALALGPTLAQAPSKEGPMGPPGDTKPCRGGGGFFEDMMSGLHARLEKIERLLVQPRFMADDDPPGAPSPPDQPGPGPGFVPWPVPGPDSGPDGAPGPNPDSIPAPGGGFGPGPDSGPASPPGPPPGGAPAPGPDPGPPTPPQTPFPPATSTTAPPLTTTPPPPTVPPSPPGDPSQVDLLSEMSCYELGYREKGHLVKVQDGRQAYCDPSYGGWLVFLRRQDGSINFTRTWDDYKRGFGDIYGEFWLGNELLHLMTNRWHYSLRVDLLDWNNQTKYAEYKSFRVREEWLNYMLIVEQYVQTSNGGDGLAYHNRMQFSTYDSDNDDYPGTNCAARDHGGWWYRDCAEVNPTGLYTTDPNSQDWGGLRWYYAFLDDRSFQKIEMKIRPNF